MQVANPKLVTDRLDLRPWNESEASDFFALTQDAGFGKFPITNYRQENLDSARAWIRTNLALHREKSMGKWGVWNKEDQSLIGMGGLTPWTHEGASMVDLTYRLKTSAWGKGFGSEIASVMLRHGFGNLGLSEITATITPDNQASKKIVNNLGFQFDCKILLLGVDTELYKKVPGTFSGSRRVTDDIIHK